MDATAKFPSGPRPAAEPDDTIIAESVAMRRALRLARRYSQTRLPVLLVGETGTGKEVLAQAIHRWSGRPGAMVEVDCGAIPAGMLANELFGHRRGAFTSAVEAADGLLAAADRGTLFLDELGSLPLEGQGVLLRVLETGRYRPLGGVAQRQVDLRLVAAVQEEGLRLVERRTLRADLHQRLSGGVIRLPPLRDRAEDIPALAHWLAREAGCRLEERAIGLLLRHDWPGNVRELRQVVQRAASLCDRRTLSADVLVEALDLTANSPPETSGNGSASKARQDMIALCRVHGWEPLAIATALGVSRSTLYRRLKGLGLSLGGEAREAQTREILRQRETL